MFLKIKLYKAYHSNMILLFYELFSLLTALNRLTIEQEYCLCVSIRGFCICSGIRKILKRSYKHRKYLVFCIFKYSKSQYTIEDFKGRSKKHPVSVEDTYMITEILKLLPKIWSNRASN